MSGVTFVGSPKKSPGEEGRKDPKRPQKTGLGFEGCVINLTKQHPMQAGESAGSICLLQCLGWCPFQASVCSFKPKGQLPNFVASPFCCTSMSTLQIMRLGTISRVFDGHESPPKWCLNNYTQVCAAFLAAAKKAVLIPDTMPVRTLCFSPSTSRWEIHLHALT